MAEAVMIAMMASFILSRTLVPTMAKYMMKGHHDAGSPHPAGA
jgi:multidrug efflux pump subunit AcrB